MAPFLLRRQYFDVFAKIMTICENSVEVADIKNKNNNTIPFNSQQVAVVQQTQQVADEQHAIRDQLTSSPLKSEGVVQIVSTSMERFKFIDSSSEESEAEDGKWINENNSNSNDDNNNAGKDNFTILTSNSNNTLKNWIS